jgi:hypothetical protein
MKRPLRLPRTPVRLSDSVHQRLNMYALAAGAAGVGALALAQPAEAKIVYTPAHVQLQANKPYPLDLDHNRKTDFFLLEFSSLTTFQDRLRALWVCHHPTVWSKGSIVCRSSTNTTNLLNQVVATKAYGPAATLRAGAKIQSGDPFAGTFKGHDVVVDMGQVFYRTSTTTQGTIWQGAWLNGGKGVKNRYLGFKFQINGKFHFGWARLNVATHKRGEIKATLTGYAYETIPNKPIIAGKTKGPDVVTVHPASLGHLAAGASAIQAWRRSESAASH